VLVSWFTAVFLKGLIYFLRREPRFFSRAFANGGMPSTHSAFVASLSAAILLKTGQSAVFYLSALFAVVVMSDAIRLRKNLGEQGDNLNKLLLKFKQNPIRVVHGHSASQVLLGAAWGIVVAVVMFSIF
jgi:acid phosphatase family membrane protein YuiD